MLLSRHRYKQIPSLGDTSSGRWKATVDSFQVHKALRLLLRFGRLRHVMGGYVAVEAREDDPCLQYGPLLRASLLKSRRYNAEFKILEEKKVFLALQNKKTHPIAKTKLMFDSPTFMNMTANGNSSGKIDGSIMSIDETTPIAPGNEAFKRKQGDTQLHKGDERKVRLVSPDNNLTISSISA